MRCWSIGRGFWGGVGRGSIRGGGDNEKGYMAVGWDVRIREERRKNVMGGFIRAICGIYCTSKERVGIDACTHILYCTKIDRSP